MSYNTVIVLLGTSLLGACAGLVGSFAVLRRRALIGDALAHAALPGLCLAFLIAGRRSLPILLFGALISSVIGIAVVAALRRIRRIREDAAIGIVLSVFYGAGIVLMSIIQRIDTGSRAGLDSYILGKTAGMIRQDVLLIAGVAAVCALLVLLLYKEFKVIAFDSGFAAVQGWPVFWLDMVLMTMIAVTVVIGLPAVGVVMVAALLIIPPATARFWTNQLGTMLWLAPLFGIATGATGTLLSARIRDLPAGPGIVLVGTTLFVVSLLFAPQRGVAARLMRLSSFRRRVAENRLLRLLFEVAEAEGPSGGVSRERLLAARSWSPALLNRILRRLTREAAIEFTDGGRVRLTASGQHHAASVVRGYRIRDMFLSEHAELAGSLASLDTEQAVQELPEDMVRAFEARLKAEGRYPCVAAPS